MNINSARRTEFEVFFAGVDITSSLQDYFLSLSYTDNEDGEADDLQLKLHDREGIWKEKWLNALVHKAASYTAGELVTKYKVTAKGGVSVRGGRDKKTKHLGTLPYGEIIEVKKFDEGWAVIDYSDKTGYVTETALSPVYTSTNTRDDEVYSTETTKDWSIGETVTVTGRPQYSSYGTGTPGKSVTNYTGSITHLNLKSGVPYPIHVGSLGWFSESQVTKKGEKAVNASSEDEASKGLKIQANIIRQNWTGNGEEEKLECGQFELDSIVCQGPPATITIKGTSLPYHATVRQTKKSKSWENYSLSKIVAEIAENNNMTFMFLAGRDTSYDRVEQYKISDVAFLSKLCEDAGCSLKITNNIIVIFDQAQFESQDPIMTIVHGAQGGYTKYKLSTGENDVYTYCRVSYIDQNGKLIEGFYYSEDYDGEKDDNQCLEITQKVTSKAEAELLAEKHLRLRSKFEFTGSFTFPGNPYLVAGCCVALEGFGCFDGRYIIKQAKHSVANGYATDISIRRCLDIATNTEVVTESKDIDAIAKEVIRGKWGNGAERKRRLTEAGYDYDTVQKRVNEMLR